MEKINSTGVNIFEFRVSGPSPLSVTALEFECQWPSPQQLVLWLQAWSVGNLNSNSVRVPIARIYNSQWLSGALLEARACSSSTVWFFTILHFPQPQPLLLATLELLQPSFICCYWVCLGMLGMPGLSVVCITRSACSDKAGSKTLG
jgi:hypothetical protein